MADGRFFRNVAKWVMLLRFLKRVLRTLALCIFFALAYLFFFQSRMIYFPPHSSVQTVSKFVTLGGKRLDYETSQGKQTAWLLPAAGNRAPERFWIVCAGNASEALSLADLQAMSGLQVDAFLLVDYPGYGVSQGKPSPATIRENLEKVVPLAVAATGFSITNMGTRGLAFGHSLGAAATLIGAEMYGIKRVILLAPFTSTMDMTQVVVHAPLGWLVRHRFDNRARLAALKKRGGHVWIFHGAKDEAIPTWMGRTLAAELGNAATYHEVSDGWHNDLFEKDGDEIMQTMHDARDWK